MSHKGQGIADRMIGRTYLFNGLEHRVKRIDRRNSHFEVHTDRTTISCSPKELHEKFLPIEDEAAIKAENTSIQRVITSNESSLGTIEETLLATIKKVQDDPKYIPQAKSIDELSRRLIDIQRLKVSMVQIVRGKNR